MGGIQSNGKGDAATPVVDGLMIIDCDRRLTADVGYGCGWRAMTATGERADRAKGWAATRCQLLEYWPSMSRESDEWIGSRLRGPVLDPSSSQVHDFARP